MAGTTLTVLAGTTATVLFVASALPMLAKARRTRDLSSYSLGNLLLANTGNAVQSVYVFNLPAGPIWVLHSFYLVTTALMLAWFLRYTVRQNTHSRVVKMRILADALRRPALLASVASEQQEA